LFIKLYYRFHAIGSRSEITGACLITQVHNILIEKSSITHSMQFDDNEESCKRWFLTAVPCLCSIEAKSSLKPKKLFCGMYEKYLVIIQTYRTYLYLYFGVILIIVCLMI